MEPRNRFRGMNYASLCSLAGRYKNSIPTLFLAHIDCLKIPALVDGFWRVVILLLCTQSKYVPLSHKYWTQSFHHLIHILRQMMMTCISFSEDWPSIYCAVIAITVTITITIIVYQDSLQSVTALCVDPMTIWPGRWRGPQWTGT